MRPIGCLVRCGRCGTEQARTITPPFDRADYLRAMLEDRYSVVCREPGCFGCARVVAVDASQ